MILYILIAGISLFYISNRLRRPPIQPNPDALPSVLVPAYTTHSRSLPTPSRHSFSYPLLYVAIDIDSLETGSLDRTLFKYGSGLKVLGLRSGAYLEGSSSLREKIDKLCGRFQNVWLVTMPSFLGFEGINPLSVWYCYNDKLECVVLEVHNTFGEKHAYVLKVGGDYYKTTTKGYDHTWVFPRSFHVSPFNSRNGFYQLDLIDPIPSTEIKVSLRLLTPSLQPKLHAVLASHPTRSPVPLSSSSWSIIATIIRYPLSLLSTTPRILYQAYRLHYERKLAVYPRPEPRALKDGVDEWNESEKGEGVGYGLGWQSPGWAEKKAQSIVLQYIRRRSLETGVGVTIRFRDRREEISTGNELVITTSDPKFFTSLVASPSALHFTTIAPEMSTISNIPLFQSFFAGTYPAGQLRMAYLHFYLARTNLSPPPELLQQAKHFLKPTWTTYLITGTAYFADAAEEWIMYMVNAKFVPGREPWSLWERALQRLYGKTASQTVELGSILY